MKAICFYTHGGIEVLESRDLPTPQPGPNQVLVKLKAAALNHLDIWVRKGWPGLHLEYPHIPGADGAGEIAALGPDVQGWSLRDRVVINSNLGCGHCEYCIAGMDNRCVSWELLGETVRGTYAQYVVIPASNAYPLPVGFDEHVAAAAGLVFHTAWHSLITRASLRPGETVLIVGASGGVNTASIQIAKLVGATVYVVGSTPEKLALAESLGADHLIDRSKGENWAKIVYQHTGKRGVDVVVDNIGTTFPLSFRSARKGGRILTVGNSGGAKFEIDNRYIFAKHLSIIGSTMGTRTDFASVMNLVFSGALKPALDRTYPLKEAQAAQKRLETGEQLGKITLEIAD
ncbi:MAG: zinc-binding dehydrogenase [Anaerolineales bacterium]|nr:MAG: zinc-binding dehydrogenase [Anaerolineales bacterium]